MEFSRNENTDTTSVSRDQQVEENVLCLEEATINDVPRSLKSLISSLPSDNLNAKELFTIILYIISIESGYCWDITESDDVPLHQRIYSFDIRRVRSIPIQSYNPWSTVSSQFEKTLYLGGVEEFKCKLVATSWANNIIVHISSAGSLLCFSSIYNISEFILQTEPIYKKLRELTILLKNNLFHPMRSYLLTEASIANPSLLGVPIEIITKIVRYVDIKDFLNLSACCNHFYVKLRDIDTVWMYFSKKYAISEKPNDISWKTHFLKNVSN